MIAARAFAYAAHAGQKLDRDGRPHMDHVERVAGLATLMVSTPEVRDVAYLHDVVEDNRAITCEMLATVGFGPVVVDAVRLLTRDDDAPLTYLEYVASIADSDSLGGGVARVVKRADLSDNLARCEAEGNERHARRYRAALQLIVA